MPDDSNGIYNVPAGTLVNTGDTVLPSQHNPWANDSAAAISNRFSKDGRAPATGNWNLNTFRLTAVGDPVANQDATNKAYVDALTAAATMPFLPRGHINGLTLSNNAVDSANDIDISPGQVAADATFNNIILNTAITKRLGAAWAVGSGNGGLDTGSIANTTYHVWLIQRSDTGVVDALFSASATAPTMPTNYDRKAYLWPILREGGAIVPFRQLNQSRFERVTLVTDRNSATALSSSLITLSVPIGVRTRPILLSTIVGNSAGAQNAENLIGSASKGSADLSFQRITAISGISQLNASIIDGTVQTNTSGQIYFATTIATGSLTSNILQTKGWHIDRGYLT